MANNQKSKSRGIKKKNNYKKVTLACMFMKIRQQQPLTDEYIKMKSILLARLSTAVQTNS